MTEPTPGAHVPPSAPVPPRVPFASSASDPNRPGSRAWVEQRYGRTAHFSDRIFPGIIDALLGSAAAFVPLVLGIICLIAGSPDTYDCAFGYSTCEVPGSGSGALIGLGILLLFLTILVSLAFIAWNRVWRVTRTGQSIGKKLTGLKVIDAESGANPKLGPAALRELVHQFAGIISWIWMLIDDDDRTLADIVGKTHVIQVDKS
ncbi:hypothetical protein ASG73_15640 [Janibacter sp. Soil728]|uniref:RDD family protein n=1 Tax=Janibacter sp. Soil728 TaxID=1736393 RepID=UPI0006FACB93|nr:RDD family protein [Janibacter sp. Soil728]KRE36084.1 hypothetical protein ASG73_15640 [Janibacter sp. Soil728]